MKVPLHDLLIRDIKARSRVKLDQFLKANPNCSKMLKTFIGEELDLNETATEDWIGKYISYNKKRYATTKCKH